MNNEILHKEIDLIQSCIKRMENNSFLLKGWYISLIAVILAIVFDKTIRIELVSLLILQITLVFWGLDGFFLRTEKLYRLKYEWVIKERISGNTDFLYDLNPYNKKMRINSDEKVECLCKHVFSQTLMPFYILPTSITLLILIYYIIF